MAKKYTKDFFNPNEHFTGIIDEHIYETALEYEIPMIELQGLLNSETISKAKERLRDIYSSFEKVIKKNLEMMERNGASIFWVGKIEEREFGNNAGNRILSVKIAYTKNEEFIEREEQLRKSLFGDDYD